MAEDVNGEQEGGQEEREGTVGPIIAPEGAPDPPSNGDRTWEMDPWLAMHDPLISDVARAKGSADYYLRNVRTVHGELAKYASGTFGGPDEKNMEGNGSFRRYVQVFPPDDVLERLDPKHRRYIPMILEGGEMPEGAETAESEKTGDKEFRVIGPDGEEELPSNRRLVFIDNRWWKFSKVTTTPVGRKRTAVYKKSVGEHVDRWHQLVREAGISDERMALRERQLTKQERFDILAAYYRSGMEVAARYHDYSDCLEAYRDSEEHSGEYKDAPDGDESHRHRLESFTTNEMWDHWKDAQRRANFIPGIGGRTPGIPVEHLTVQTIRESVDADEDLADMMSTVLEPARLYVEGKGKDARVSILHTDVVATATGYDFSLLRKFLEGRVKYLEGRGAMALSGSKEGDPRSTRDGWGFGPMPDRTNREVKLFGLSPIDMRIILGPWSDEPDSFKTPDGPKLAGMNLKSRVRKDMSHADLEKLIHRIFGEKDIVNRKELKDKFDFIQWEREDLSWTFWDSGENPNPHSEEEWFVRSAIAQFLGGAPLDWELHAVPHDNPALRFNWWWTMESDHFIEPQQAVTLNDLCRKYDIDVRMRYDGPDANFFRHQDFAYEVWRNMPLKSIKARADSLVIHLNEVGDWLSLRSEIAKFFSDLPTRHDGRPDVTRLFEKYLKWADEQALFLKFWYSAEGYSRYAEGGDVKRLLDGGWGVYPTEGLAEEYPDVRWGAPSLPEERYNPYDFPGQQKARAAFMMMAYENMVVSTMKGIMDRIIAGGNNFKADDVLGDLLSALGSRKLYWKRLKRIAKTIDEKFPLGTRKVADIFASILKKTPEQEEIDLEPSVAVDKFGLILLRNVVGAQEGDGNAVDAVRNGKFIAFMRARLPGA